MKLPKCNRRILWSALVCALFFVSLLMMGGCYRSYVCENGKIIEARDQLGGERVIIDLGEGDVTLPRVPAASGSKYSDGRRTFWFQGNELTVEVDGKNLYGRCAR
ncbi:MAG TPA: MliC family protein [Syntrophales bacterium]|nr:MliC family protein [Syntrophales bacterium]